MNRYGYSWEAVTVATAGGDSTLFHITGKNGYEWFKPTRPEIPVLVMPAAFMDGTSWFEIDQVAFGLSKNTPLPAALYDAGFDVWIGNTRGTEYAKPTSWDFTLVDLSKDVETLVLAIKNKTGMDKVNYVGYGLGNMTMFYGAATNSAFYLSNIHKFVALNPCVVTSAPKESSKEVPVMNEETGEQEINPTTNEPKFETVYEPFT